jgi:hypothetical protein
MKKTRLLAASVSLALSFTPAVVFAQQEEQPPPQEQHQQPPQQQQQAYPPPQEQYQYPPQQQGYPPSQQGQYQYPPQQQGYPPQQGQYQYPPQQQQGYPPPQGQYQYPPQQQGYPPPQGQYQYPPQQQAQQPEQSEQPKKERPPSSKTLIIGYGNSSVESCYKSDCVDLPLDVGFRIGYILGIPLVSVLSIQTGGMINIKGYETEPPKYESNGIEYYLGYFQVPVMASAKYYITKSIAAKAGLGPYIAFGVFGIKDNDMYNYDDLSRFDFGISFDIGVELGRFYAGVAWDEGLFNIADTSDDDVKVTNSTFGVVLGFIF